MDSFRQRISFSSSTVSDDLLDRGRENEFQDLIMFHGVDETGNMIVLCINQFYNCKQSDSLIYIRDHTGVEYTSKETDNGSYEFSNWKTPSLQFQCVVPMQTWRIVFCGLLRNGENHHYVKINILWKPFGFPVYCNKNNTFFKHEIDGVDPSIVERLLGFDQFGQISGATIVDGKTEMINMRGMKLRRWNMSPNDVVFVGFTDGGISVVQKLERINCGGHLKTNSEHETLTSSVILMPAEEDDNPIFLVRYKDTSLKTNLEKNRSPTLLNSVSVGTLFGDGFEGTLLRFRQYEPKNHSMIDSHGRTVLNECVELSVNLDSDLCTRNDIVGNKAMSLFRLRKSIADGLIYDVVVPDGICITTVAMKNHLKENEDLFISLRGAIEMTKENCDFVRLSDYCERLKTQWRSSNMSAELLVAISHGVREHVSYAVRSSGTYEDGATTSAAGQYVTVLGCAGRPADVAAAVLECWTSNFSARSLTYRKMNGQPLMCDMAIIVQEQIIQDDRTVSGVAFSRDPITGDPRKIIVAASYGPDQDVVSGSVEPDSVEVSRRFAMDDTCCAASRPLSKLDFSVKIVGLRDNVRPRASDDLLKKLAGLCVQAEGVFGSPQDIEWIVVEDRVYLLQSRPITSIFAWNDEEITREFDTPFTNNDVAMFYNAKEVYPNPVHPLSLTLDFFSAYPLFNLAGAEPTDVFRKKQLFRTHFNLCFNVCQMFQDLEPDSVFVKIIEYSLAGKHFLTNDVWEKISSTSRSSGMKKFLKNISTFKEIFRLESRLAETLRLICNANMEQSDSLLELLNVIIDGMDVLEKVIFCHMASSTNNVVSHTLLAILGLDFNKESTTESLSELAASINTPDIINVSILKDIQTIAGVISEMSTEKEFCQLPVQDCHDWLKLNCPKGYDQVNDFIEKYGHRGVQELDFGSETWSTDPCRLFSCLQSLILSGHHRQSPGKPPENHRSSTIPGGYVKKLVYDYLLERYRQSISYREQSKDMLAKFVHKLRTCYRKLGEKLVAEERIPDSKLIFFMSQYEVKRICHDNCPGIVHKASKRRKLWPSLFSLQFDDVCSGPPVPTNSSHESEPVDGSVRLKGCCVYPGRVKNRACVLDRIEDARHLRPGDVLIVKSVDIAWSPYFPIISGLVTEIGGIISHGAVVAREYGLPCLVGVKNVKKHFKTGDTVILNSEKGFVIKDDATS